VELVQILTLVLAGAVAGFLAGFFGIGGGIILVPLLLQYFDVHGVAPQVATQLALGTSLLVIVFASLSSAPHYLKHGLVVPRAVVIMSACSIAGAFVGSGIAVALPGKVLQMMFGIVVAGASVKLFFGSKDDTRKTQPDLRARWLIATGFSTGVASAMVGVGGGIFWIPVMHALLKFPLKKAIGTSSAAIVLTALAGCAGYALRGLGNPLLGGGTLGYVDYVHALPLIIGTVPMGRLGAGAARSTSSPRLRVIFAGLLLLVAVRMWVF
jgi:uncharacterized protein